MVRSAARAQMGDVVAGRPSLYEIIGLAYKWETFSFHLLRLEQEGVKLLINFTSAIFGKVKIECRKIGR